MSSEEFQRGSEGGAMRVNALMVIMAAMGCGMIAAMGVSQMEDKPHQQVAVAGEVQLFVAGVAVPEGEPLTPQHVRLERWPRDRVPDGAITRLEDFHRQVAGQALYPGQPLRRALLRDTSQVVSQAATRVTADAEPASAHLPDNLLDSQVRTAVAPPPQSFPLHKPLVVRISMSVHPDEEAPDETGKHQDVLLVPTEN